MAIAVSHDATPSLYGNLALRSGQLRRRDEITQRVQRMHEQKLARRQAARQAEQNRRLAAMQMEAKQAEQDAGREFQREMLGLRTRYEQLGYRDKAGVNQQNTMERMRFAAAEKQDARLASLAAEEAMLAKKMDAERDQFQWEFSERQKQEMTQYNHNLQRIDEALEAGELSPTEHAEARNQVLSKLVGIKKQPALKEETPWEPGRGPGETWNTTLPDGTEIIMTCDDKGNVKELSRREGPDFSKVLDAAIKASTDENGVDQEKVKAYMENARQMWMDWSGKTQPDVTPLEAGGVPGPATEGDVAFAESIGAPMPQPDVTPLEAGGVPGPATEGDAGPVDQMTPEEFIDSAGPIRGMIEQADRPQVSDADRLDAAVEHYRDTASSVVDRFTDDGTAPIRTPTPKKPDAIKDEAEWTLSETKKRHGFESDEDARLAVRLSGGSVPLIGGWDKKNINSLRKAIEAGDGNAIGELLNNMKHDIETRVAMLREIKQALSEGEL